MVSCHHRTLEQDSPESEPGTEWAEKQEGASWGVAGKLWGLRRSQPITSTLWPHCLGIFFLYALEQKVKNPRYSHESLTAYLHGLCVWDVPVLWIKRHCQHLILSKCAPESYLEKGFQLGMTWGPVLALWVTQSPQMHFLPFSPLQIISALSLLSSGFWRLLVDYLYAQWIFYKTLRIECSSSGYCGLQKHRLCGFFFF